MNIFKFTFFKYLNFILLFARGTLLSLVLSYEDYATWGVVMFVASYHSIAGFGIPKIILTKLKDKNSIVYYSKMIGSSIISVICLGVIYYLIYLILINSFDINIQYNLSILNLIILSCLLLINEVFMNAARYKKLYKIIILAEFLSILPLLIFLTIFPEHASVNSCLIIFLISITISIIIYIFYVSIIFDINNLSPFFKLILNLGIPLLLFNYSSYLIFILFRYYILNNYDEIVVSNFNFGWFIANAFVLMLNTFNWYLYPMVLRNLSTKSNKNFNFHEFFYLQIIISFIVSCISIPVFEFVTTNYYSKFEFSTIHFKFILISQLIYYLSTYSSSYLVAIDKKRGLVYSGIFSGLFFIFFLSSIDPDLNNIYYGLIFSSLIFLFLISYNINFTGNKIVFYLLSLFFASISLIENNYIFLMLLCLSFMLLLINFNFFKSVIFKIKNETNNF
jgi:O-antigen/teichoic acid export membrane protein